MDSQKIDYIIEFLTKGDTQKAVTELQKLQGVSEKTTSSMSTLAATATRLVGALAIEEFVRRSVVEFMEAEKAVSKLEAALRSTGQYTPEISKHFRELAESLEKTTNFDGESILNVISKLVALG